MINRIKIGLIALVGVAIWGLTPGVVHAAKVHSVSYNCNDCHKMPGANPRAMTNLCTNCHSNGSPRVAEFSTGDASNAGGNNPPAVGNSSHIWGQISTAQPAAGSAHPARTFYNSSYSISTGLVTCSICHDPHGMEGTKLLRATAAGDLLCQQCHIQWFVANPNALRTHPIVANYLTTYATDANKFVPATADANGKLSTNVGNGDVRLVNGGISCTTCHSTHYVDSNATTTDGVGQALANGDGNLLRADGPLRTGGATRGTAVTGTAQLRSNLCQTCHVYKLHGLSTGPNRIGCLDCHGGHSYNNGTPSDYVLADRSPDAVPIRLNKAANGTAVVDYPNFLAATSSRLSWSDNVKGGANPGFCEKCHGDVQDDAVGAVGLLDTAHLAGALTECDVCHKHNDLLYSFAKDANAATCGQCHGFPPYLNVRGDNGNDPDGTGPGLPLGTLGGYGYNYVDLPAYDYVNSTTYEKDETKTAHKTHAGYNLTGGAAAGWYFVGRSGIQNCQPCHGDGAGSTNHRVNNTESFRNVPFNAVAYLPVASPPTPVYNTGTFVCTNTYCHSNGGERNATGTKTAANFKLRASPYWVGNGTSYAIGGFGSITVASPCSQCHGNTVATMDAADKDNSVAHKAHLGNGPMTKTYGCEVCHVKSAASATTLAPNATDGQQEATGGGRHVNGAVEVDYKTSGSTLYTKLLTNGADTTYDNVNGTCANYCHDPDNLGTVADWDSVTVMQCDSCHGGLSTDSAPGFGPITSGSHPLHVTAANGPRLACSKCHGTNADIGKHGTHIDGVDDFTAGVCDTCHGYSGTLGEALPVWGATPYADADLTKRDDYCVTCHTGVVTPVLASGGIAAGAPAKTTALTTGHGLPSSTYPLSGNNAANRTCTDCHDLAAAGHFDGTSGDDKRLILGSNGFPVAYTTVADKNNHCNACHGTSPGHVPASSKTGMNTHQAKACIACHDPHGDSNRAMILTSSVTQNAKDTVGTGKFAANVTFTALTGAFSFDEDEGAADGNANEINNNDICATCHTTGGGSSHNNNQNLPTTGNHNQGSNCLSSCHYAHTNATNAFGGGTASDCNGCHGYPPATGDARHTAAKIGAHELHSSSALPVGGAEASDCELCHPGATGYTLTLGGTHGDTGLGGATTMVGGMAGGTATCTNSCHLSTASVDGYWTDTTKAGYAGNGLNCNACHYAAQAPSGANNIAAGTKQVSATHNEHFNKNSMTCAQCHDVSYTDAALTGIPGGAGGLIHISTPGDTAGSGAWYQNRAAAALDEATVTSSLRPTMTYSAGVADAAGANNRCAGGGIALGCHATGSPDWDVAIPATSAGCVMCHTGTSVSTVDPTSSLHAVVPTVTGKQHAGNFTYNAGANTADCTTCHTAVPTITAGDHINGTFNASIGADAGAGQKITLVAGLGYADGVVPTCNVSTTGCHTAKTAPQSRSWLYKWHNNGAATNGKQCDGCHGMWADLAYGSGGWNSGVIAHRDASEAETYHGTGATYKCKDCHGLESASGYPFTTTSNDWKPTEVGTTLHGDGNININTNGGATFSRTPYSGCTSACHLNTDGVAAGQHGFTVTTWGTTTITGDAIVSTCYSCHGGATIVGANANYWPDGANTINDNATPDNSGAHLGHITALASKIMGQNITQLLTDNAGVGTVPWNTATADAKQLELCSYCHRTPIGNDADHKVTYPADLTTASGGFLNLWNKAADDGAYTTATGSCATTNCHNNVSTTAGYYWYAGGVSACAMCHTNGATDAPHVSHLAPAMGTVTCLACHGTGTTTTAAPTAGHIDGSLTVVGTLIGTAVNGTTVNYSGGLNGTCGTVNACHTTGVYNGTVLTTPKGGTTFTWGVTTFAGCDACHETTSTLASGSHANHLLTTSQSGTGAITCNSCHTAATVSTHMNQSINFTGAATNYGTETIFNITYLGNCGTNACHNNGKNGGAPYNNGLGSYAWNNSAIGAGVNTCTECHGNTAVNLTSEAHDTHLNASAGLFGGPAITCSSCHAAATATSHVDGTINIAGMTYGGDVATTGTTFGSCGTNACHKDGKGGAPAVTSYDWNTTQADCSICHLAKPTTGAHNTHLTAVAWGPYPAGTTVCDMCHLANNNNTTMAGKTTHMNNTISFNGPSEVATGAMATDTGVTACSACHGNITAANVAGGAKKSWATAARLACGTCHGDYTDAVVLTKTAPHNAGTAAGQYTLAGHGKAGVAKTCTDCHDLAAAGHIDGTSNDDKRMKTVNAQTYGARYAAASINYCGLACHATSMQLHYTNGASGLSFPANGAMDCLTCHNPHGQTLDVTSNALATMIRPTIDGKLIVGFYNKATQNNYFVNPPNNGANNRYGICQACHDPTDASASGGTVGNFNRSIATPTHQSSGLCTTCHKHVDSPSFKASGGACNGCHGYPPVQQNGVGTAGNPYTFSLIEDYPGGGRAHAVPGHIPTTIVLADGWAPCAPCHTEADHNTALDLVTALTTQRDTPGNWGNEALRYPRVNLSAAYDRGTTGLYNMGNRATASVGMGYCSNTTCHFSASPKWDCLPADTTNDPQ